jgi:hypothetical protein
MIENDYLQSTIKLFGYYKSLGDKSIERISDDKIHFQWNEESNSIANIVKHLSGNMLSRWTDFLTSDGEKPWRNRDAEFEPPDWDKAELLTNWEKGWSCLLLALNQLNNDDLEKIIYIRNEGHTVMEAINRQLAHYAYHVGQLVFLAKAISTNWESLSIAKNKSGEFNQGKFSQEETKKHFV